MKSFLLTYITFFFFLIFFFFNEDLFVGLRPRLSVYTSKLASHSWGLFKSTRVTRAHYHACLSYYCWVWCSSHSELRMYEESVQIKPPGKCRYCFSSFLFFPILFFLSPPSSLCVIKINYRGKCVLWRPLCHTGVWSCLSSFDVMFSVITHLKIGIYLILFEWVIKRQVLVKW